MNNVTAFGTLTKDAKEKTFDNNKVISFTIAVNSSRKAKNSDGYEADFIRCVYTVKKDSRVTEYLKKGSSVLVEGFIRPRSFEADGKKVYLTEIAVRQLELQHSGNGINVATISGRLTRNAEVRTHGEYFVLNFSVASQRPFKNKNTGEYDADFVPVSYFCKKDSLSSYLQKGTPVVLTGSIRAGSYKDKNGEWKDSFSVVARNVRLAGKLDSGSASSSGTSVSIPDNADIGYSDYSEIIDDDGEVPF